MVTDHHPLVPILNNHRLDEVENPRLQRLKMRVMGYNFTAQWIEGALNHAPDALSCHPTADPSPVDLHAEHDADNELEITVAEIRAFSSGQESVRLGEIRRHAELDGCYQQLRHYIMDGFPDYHDQLPDECRRYWNVRDRLSVDDGLIVYGCRLLIPAAMRREVLSSLHDSSGLCSHQGEGTTHCLLAWPG